ncbi:hypothetical protein B0H13DRAFT_1911449 [Mycena leptocephala]|nr:hypothetical protein B0H13DRAFT_1911449 [Mycena leptocephala]
MQVSNVSAGVSRHWEGKHSPRIQALGYLQKKDVISGYGFGRRAKRNGEKTNFGFRVVTPLLACKSYNHLFLWDDNIQITEAAKGLQREEKCRKSGLETKGNAETMIAGDTYPKHFLPFTRNTANIVAIVGQEYPGEPADILIFCEDDSKVILVSSPPLTVEDKSLSGPGALGNSWRNTPTLHLGIRERYTSIITGDSYQIDTPVDKQEKLVNALHNLCSVVKVYWLPKIRVIVEWYYLGQEWKIRMHAHILKHLGCDLTKYPNFDFGGMTTTLVVKEGGNVLQAGFTSWCQD